MTILDYTWSVPIAAYVLFITLIFVVCCFVISDVDFPSSSLKVHPSN